MMDSMIGEGVRSSVEFGIGLMRSGVHVSCGSWVGAKKVAVAAGWPRVGKLSWGRMT